MPRDSAIDTPTKAKISRRFQQLGGEKTPGAATSTAREFGLLGSDGCTRVKKYDKQIAEGTASRKFKGRISRFNSDLEGDIEEAFADDDTQTYREVCEKLGLPKTTLYRYATEVMDYRCLDQKVRPIPSAENRAKRVEMAQVVVAHKGPFMNEWHQDEKYYIQNSRRRQRKVRKSDKEGAQKAGHEASRKHQTQVMFSGCCGVGPFGEPAKVHFEWICKKKTAARNSKYHKRGDVYYENATMDAESYEKDLNIVGKEIRAYYTKAGKEGVRPKLQIDSAGGHGMARGEVVFKKLQAMMLSKYNIELVQQPGNSPFWNILDLTIWQASQLEVDKMNGTERHL